MAIAGETKPARAWFAVVAIALVATTIWLGTVLFSFESDSPAACCCREPPVFALARYAILDMIFTAFLFGGVSLIAAAALKDRPGLQWPGCVLIALSVVTKGRCRSSCAGSRSAPLSRPGRPPPAAGAAWISGLLWSLCFRCPGSFTCGCGSATRS
jgi:hypothetical protein